MQKFADLEVIALEPAATPGPPRGVRLSAGTVEECVALARDLTEAQPVDGVFTMTEQLLVETAALAAQLGLPHHSVEAATRMRDKSMQRAALRAAGMRTPRLHEIHAHEDLDPAIAQVGFPAVLKPSIGMASLATWRIDGRAELVEAYDRGLALYARDHRVVGLPAVFLLEELLVGQDSYQDPRFGDYVSVETISFLGNVHVVTVQDKLPLQPPFREAGQIMPSSLPAAVHDACVAEAVSAVGAMGGTHGAAHTEVKLTPEGPVVIEVNGRLGGIVSELLLLCSDYDIVANLARVSLGQSPELPVQFRGWASSYHPHVPQDVVEVTEVTGVAEARALKDVTELQVVAVPGKRLDPASSNTRLIRALSRHDTVEDAFGTFSGLDATLRPTYRTADRQSDQAR